MKMLKVLWGLILFCALVAVIQLADPASDGSAGRYQMLPDANLRGLAEAEWGSGRPESALLVLDFLIENNAPDKLQAGNMRQQFVSQLLADHAPLAHLKAVGWAQDKTGGNTFENLAGASIGDSVVAGDIAKLAQDGVFEDGADEFIGVLNAAAPVASVFPPAGGALTLLKAAKRTGAINDAFVKQLRQMLDLVKADPRSALAVEKVRDNLMPIIELARRCRTWGEFQVLLRQADGADQVRVLTKMISTTPGAPKHLSQILVLANRDSHATASVCLDAIMRQGPGAIDTLYAAVNRGPAGVKFAAEHPGLSPFALARMQQPPPTFFGKLQKQYLAWRFEYGAIVPAIKYLLIAVFCAWLVLLVVPGHYLEKLLTSGPGNAFTAGTPGPVHYVLSALAVGAVLAGLAYLLSLATRPLPLTEAAAGATGALGGEPGALGLNLTAHGDNAWLSGTVVLISLAIHAIVWFFVRGKIRQVEDDEMCPTSVRLKRLDNLDVFLDLPLFTGLALTVVAFILITLDAGMSRHFAYTSTVVGILSSVSLRIRYVFPLKERLIQLRQPGA